jgi:DNA-binding CsgD family transcriptional regulator
VVLGSEGVLVAASGAGDSVDCLARLGRSGALVMLRESAAAARSGKAAVLSVRGVAGIGKTCLLDRARAELERQEGIVLFATGSRPGSRGETIRELFAPLGLTVPEASASPLLAGAAQSALPALMAGSGVPHPEAGDAVYPVLHGLYRLAVNLMADRPLTIMLDDAHLCDPLALRWVDFLLRRAGDHALLVVLASEPDAAEPQRGLLSTIAGHNAGTVIELGPLSEPEVADVVAAALGAETAPSFVRVCWELSGGHPLLLRMLLERCQEQGVRPDGAGARLAAEVGAQALSGALPVRLDRLSDSVRRVAAGIALLGADEPWMVAALLGLPLPAVAAAVAVLRRHGLLTADRWEFVSEQVRGAVLGDLPSGQLDALRLRAARLLQDEGCPPEEVARLLVDLGRLDEPWMLSTLREAAADARRRGEPEAGVRFLNRLAQAVPDDAETLVELATTLADIDPEAAVSHFLRALERTEDLRARVMLVSFLGVLSLEARKAAPAFRLLSDVLDMLEADPEMLPAADDLRREIQAVLLGVGLRSRSTVQESIRRARTMTVPVGHTPAERLALGMLASTAMLDGGSRQQAVERARAAVSGSLVIHNGPLIMAAKILDRSGLPLEALAALDRIVADSKEAGSRWTHCHALAARSSVAAGMGRSVEAEADARAAMELARLETWSQPRIAFASLLLKRGEFAQVEAVLGEIRQPDFVWGYHEMLMIEARAKILLNDVEGGLSVLLRCGRSMAETGIRSAALVPWWLDAVDVLVAQDRRLEALALVESQVEAITGWETQESIGLGLVARGCATGGRQGLELMEAGVEALAASPARFSQLRAELIVGHTLFRSGDDAEARKYLHRAADRAVRCGCPILGAKAKKLLKAAGGRVRKLSGRSSDLLTAAEWRVVEQVAAGATNREIAEVLFVAVRTVETHLSSVYRKLGVSSRTKIASALGEFTPALTKHYVSEQARVPVAVAAASVEGFGRELRMGGYD